MKKLYNVMKTLLLIVVMFLTIHDADAQMKSVAYWQNEFDNGTSKFDYAKYRANSLGHSSQDDTSYSGSYWHYNLAYGIDALTAMFEATSDTDYIDTALAYINNVIDDAQPTCSIPNNESNYNDSYYGWIQQTIDTNPTPDDTIRLEVVLNESYLFRYVTKLLRVIKQTPALYNNSAIFQDYRKILSFTEKQIWEKWYKRQFHEVYNFRTNGAAHWAYIAMDLYLISNVNSCEYYEVFNNINYVGIPQDSADLITWVGGSLRSQYSHPDITPSYSWYHSTWDGTSYAYTYIQDVSHSNAVVSYIVEAHDQCIYWVDSDLVGLQKILTDVIWDGDTCKDCLYSSSCWKQNGGTTYENDAEYEGLFQSDGWLKLGRYDSILQKYLEDTDRLNSMLEDNANLSKYGFNIYAQFALNKKILDGTPSTCTTATTPYPMYTAPNVIKGLSGDYNGDGYDDYAAFYDNEDQTSDIHVWTSLNGNGFRYKGAWWKTSFNSLHKASMVDGRLVSGDFNGDGYDDIAGLYDYGNNNAKILVFASDPDSTRFKPDGYAYKWWEVTDSTHDVSRVTDRLVAGDFNNDGKDDIAGLYDYGSNTAKIHVFISDNDTGKFKYDTWWESNSTHDASMATNRLVAGDFNNDGHCDIGGLYDYGGDSSKILVFISDPSIDSNKFKPDGYAYKWWESNGGNYDATMVTGRLVAGDFNDDDHCDIAALSDLGSSVAEIHTFLSDSTTGNNKFLPNGYAHTWWESNGGNHNANLVTDRLVAGDFNNDGHYDIAGLYDYSNDKSRILTFVSDPTVDSNKFKPDGYAYTFWKQCTLGQETNKWNNNDVNEKEEIPIMELSKSNFEIYPNPQTDGCYIAFNLEEIGDVDIVIHSLNGQLVKQISINLAGEGNNVVSWDRKNTNGTTVAPGIYFCTLKTDSSVSTKKIVVMD